jgi:DNA-binding NtrC family response regulator
MTQKTVLIIDDGVDFVTAYETLLQANGYRTVSAFSAAQGAEQLAQHSVDLILLDIMMEMPDSGFDFMQELQAQNSTIPVILCSSIADASQMNFDLSALGASAIVQKPVDLDELLALVEKYIL